MSEIKSIWSRELTEYMEERKDIIAIAANPLAPWTFVV